MTTTTDTDVVTVGVELDRWAVDELLADVRANGPAGVAGYVERALVSALTTSLAGYAGAWRAQAAGPPERRSPVAVVFTTEDDHVKRFRDGEGAEDITRDLRAIVREEAQDVLGELGDEPALLGLATTEALLDELIARFSASSSRYAELADGAARRLLTELGEHDPELLAYRTVGS